MPFGTKKFEGFRKLARIKIGQIDETGQEKEIRRLTSGLRHQLYCHQLSYILRYPLT